MSTKKEALVVANFKMNFNMRYELQHWFTNFTKAKKGMRLDSTRLVLCPPFIHLSAFISKIRSKQVSFGVQDCFWEQKGAFTGEISPTMIKSFGGKYVIVGHSERRRYKGETNKIINYKVVAALKAGLQPILCMGENAEEKKHGRLLSVISKQFKECLYDVGGGRIKDMIICYEPVWAISANKPDHLPTTDEIMEAKLLIKKLLYQKYEGLISKHVRIIYGGSVASRNVSEVCVDAGMDGALVGGASLSPHEFIKIAQTIDL